jgi:hypothetical protein
MWDPRRFTATELEQSPVDLQHKTAIAAIERTIETSEVLRANLRSNEAIGRKMIKKLEDEVPISQCVDATGAVASEVRQSTNDLLAEYERHRHEMRLVFIGPSLDEGMSIGAIGRTLGVSRQLAARLAKESRSTSLSPRRVQKMVRRRSSVGARMH